MCNIYINISLWNHKSFSINLTMRFRTLFKTHLGFFTLCANTLIIHTAIAMVVKIPGSYHRD